MEKGVYYSTADINRIVGVSITDTKEIAGAVSDVLTNFGAKERRAWRFNRKEMFFIKFVSSITCRSFKQSAAIAEALDHFYGIDCKRDV